MKNPPPPPTLQRARSTGVLDRRDRQVQSRAFPRGRGGSFRGWGCGGVHDEQALVHHLGCDQGELPEVDQVEGEAAAEAPVAGELRPESSAEPSAGLCHLPAIHSALVAVGTRHGARYTRQCSHSGRQDGDCELMEAHVGGNSTRVPANLLAGLQAPQLCLE